MIRTLKASDAAEHTRFKVPKKVQQTIPVTVLHEDGIFEFTRDKLKRYSKTFKFTDINYFIVSNEERAVLFSRYCDLINVLDAGSTAKITISNHRIDRVKFESQVLKPRRKGQNATFQNEYNSMLKDKIGQNSGIVQDKYLTISILRKDIDEAKEYFQRIGPELAGYFQKLDSGLVKISTQERLRLFHDFLRAGEDLFYDFDLSQNARLGHSFKDYICPDGIENHIDYLRLGEKYARALYIQNYPTYLRDSLISELMDMKKQMMLSIDLIPVPTHEAVKAVQDVLLGINTNAVNYNKRQVREQSFAELPYEVQQQQNETTAMLKDLTENDQRMMFSLVSLVHLADSKKELDSDTETLTACAQKHMCQMGKPVFRQIDALQTVLPFGVRRLTDVRTMTTSGAAALVPFRTYNLQQAGGIYYGQNPANMNMILCDRLRLLNGNGFIFGKSGGGKSFTVKREMEDVILGTNDDVFILDPEREYGALVRALGGVVIRLSPASSNHINAMDMDDYYAGDDVSPIPAKIDFIVSLCEQSDDSLDQKDRSIIDRCAKKLLMEYVNNGRHGKAPTLVDLREEILHQSDKRAADIALSLEILTTGTLNTFSQETNVDLSNRLVCFDIKDLGTQLKTLGMLIALDAIINKVSQNRKNRKRTWVYVDEFHLFNANEYARKFFIAFWKRARKYGALLTGITQNVGDLLRNSETHDILANSEFSVMLDQAPTDAAAFTALYNLSDEQVQHLQSGVVGHGLIKYGNAIVPFDDKFPTDTKLYKVMTTKIEETEEAD